MEDKQSMNLSAEEARHIIQEKKKLIEQLQKEIQSETKKMQKNRNSIRTHKAMKLYGDLIAILGYDEIEKNCFTEKDFDSLAESMKNKVRTLVKQEKKNSKTEPAAEKNPDKEK